MYKMLWQVLNGGIIHLLETQFSSLKWNNIYNFYGK